MLNLLTQILTGAITGYITNDIAINLLFEKLKLGKFEIGGFIVKDRKKFETSVSKMIEEEIINHKTLKTPISSIEFKTVISKIVQELLSDNIIKIVGNDKMYDIDGFKDLKTKLIQEVSELFFAEFNTIKQTLFEKINLSTLLTEEQLIIIFKKIFPIIKKQFLNLNSLNTAPSNFYNFIKNKTLIQIIGEDFSHHLVVSLSKIIKEIINDKKSSTKIIKYLKITINSVLSKTIKSYFNNISSLTFVEIFGEHNLIKIVKYLKKILLDFYSIKKVKTALNELSEEFINKLKKNNTPLSELLTESVIHEIKEFVKSLLPIFLKEVKKIIGSKSLNIKEFINSKIKNAIKNEGRFTSFDFVADELYNNFTSHDIVKKIEKAIKDPKNIPALEKKLMLLIDTFIFKNTVNSILNSNEKFLKQFNKSILAKLPKIVNSIPEKNIVNFVADINISFFITENKIQKIKHLLCNKAVFYIQSSKAKQYLLKNVESNLINLGQKKIRVFVSPSLFQEFHLSNKANHILFDIKTEKRIESFFVEKTKSYKISNLIYKMDKVVFSNRLKNMLNQYKNIHIGNSLLKISNDRHYNFIASNLISVLSNNLEYLLKGQVESLVMGEVEKIENEDLKNQVESIMGSELKIINIIGAGLGAIISPIGAYLIDPMNTSIYSFVLFPIVYGGIGYITNVLAIYSLFKPYNKTFFLQGVVPKNKKRFSKNLSSYIDENLISQEKLESIISNQRRTIVKTITTWLQNKDYEKVRKGLIKNKYLLAIKIYKSGINYLSNTKSAKKIIYKILNNFTLTDIINKTLINEPAKILSGYANTKIIFLINSIFEQPKFIKKTIFSKTRKKHLTLTTQKLITSNISNKKFINNNFIENKIATYINTNKHKKLKNVFNTNHDDYDKYVKYIYNYIIDDEFIEKIKNKIKVYLNKNITPNSSLKNIFNGNLHNIINKNISVFSNFILEEGIRYFNKEKTTIAKVIFKKYQSTKKSKKNLEKGFMWLTKTDSIIKSAVQNILNELPPFIISKKEIISYKIHFFYNKQLSNKTLNVSVNMVDNTLKSIINSSLNTASVQSKINVLGYYLFDFVFEKKLEDILNTVNTNQLIKELCKNLQLTSLLNSFKNELKQEKNYKHLTKNLINILGDAVSHKSINELLDFSSKLEIKNSFTQSLSSNIHKSKIIDNILAEFIIKLKEEFSNSSINNFVDLDKLTSDVQNTIFLLQKEEYAVQTIIKQIEEIIKIIALATPTETFSYANKKLVIPAINTTINNSFEILKSIDLRNITEKELNNMEANKIHKVFNSFAGRYFKKLKLYGWGGFISGIGSPLYPLIIPYIALSPLAFIFAKLKLKKNKHTS